MKNKKSAMKRLLALIITFAMVFSVMPTGMSYVSAEEDAVVSEETDVTDDDAAADEETSTDEDVADDETSTEEEEIPSEEEESAIFEDVDADAWYYEYVEYVYTNGIMEGTSETTFAPDMELTREQFVTVLWKMEGKPVVESEDISFPDVDADEWYTEAVLWAVSAGVANGYGNGLFGVGDKIAREQLVTMLCNYADATGYATDEKADLTTFADYEEVSSWAVDGMAWAVGTGIISGTGEGNLNPAGVADRAQCAKMIAAFKENAVETGFASGNGTEEKPYIVSDAEELQNFAEMVNAGETFEDKYIALSDDIDLEGIAWTPIGGGEPLAEGTVIEEVEYDLETPSLKFMGTFDGAGHTVKNLSIEADYNYVGLFGHNGGTIKNVTVEGKIAVTGEHDYVAGIAAFNTGLITRVISKIEIDAPDSYNVGGIAGVNIGLEGHWKNSKDEKRSASNAVGLVLECGNEAKLTALRNLGGIVGTNYGEITSCYNYGDIDFWWEGSMSKIGGIAGACAETGDASWAPGHITNCYNTGYIQWINTVQSSKGYGGIVCFIGPTSSITNCYNIGELKVGRNDHTPICPRYDSAKYIVNNYSLDTLTIAYMEDLKVESLSGKQRSEEQFKSEEFLAEIGGAYASDVNNINNGYPVLKWQNGVETTVTGVESAVEEITIVEGQTFADIVSSIKLNAVYDDGTKEYIPSFTYTCDKEDAFTMEDDGSTFTVSCDKGSADIKIKMEQRELSYITVWTAPKKFVYNVGDTFDPTGMKIYAYYTNELLGNMKYGEVTDYTWTTNGTLSEKNNVVTIFYTLNGATSSVSFELLVVNGGTEPAADENGVYQLATAADLDWFAKQVSYFGNTTINAALTADIDASAATFEPIGKSMSYQPELKFAAAPNGTAPSYTSKLYLNLNNAYAGTFDGNGHAITVNMTGTSNYTALFGYTNNATIQNLTVKGSVTGTQYVAGINANGAATIKNCVNEATITGTSNYVAGISANGNATLTDCKNTGDISGANYVGGINAMSAVSITGCGNEGTVTGTGQSVAGISGRGVETLNKCYNTGAVSGRNYVGGIVGWSTSNATIQNSYNKGDVTSTASTAKVGVGGIVGTVNAYTTMKIAGCYNVGTITDEGTNENAAVGEIVGYAGNAGTNYMLTITGNTYYVKDAEGTKVAVGAVNNDAYVADGAKAKTLAQLSELAASLESKVFQNSCGGPVFTTQEVVEHTGEWIDAEEAGTQTRTCEVCGHVEERTVEAEENVAEN